MGFFAKKVLEYQRKKLVEAEKNLQTHLNKIEQLKEMTGSDKEIANQDKMIEIWNRNIEKIKREINKIQEKD